MLWDAAAKYMIAELRKTKDKEMIEQMRAGGAGGKADVPPAMPLRVIPPRASDSPEKWHKRVSNLIERFPTAGEAECATVLARHEGHAGKASRELMRAHAEAFKELERAADDPDAAAVAHVQGTAGGAAAGARAAPLVSVVSHAAADFGMPAIDRGWI